MYPYNIYKFNKIFYFYKITAIKVFLVGVYDIMRPFS